jgi:gliding motility-associated-like protein
VEVQLRITLLRLLHTLLGVRYSLFIASLVAAISSSAQVDFSANHTSGCTPLGVVLSVTTPAAASIQSYAWTITTPNGTVQQATSSTYTAIFSVPGTYDVSLTINGNQTVTKTAYITVNALPVADFLADDVTGCFPHCVNFTDNSTPGSAPITSWSWDFGNGSSSSEQDPQNCYQHVGTFTPVFSVSDANGCFSVKSIPGLVSVQNNFPTANFTRSSQLDCNPPVAITMTNTSSGNGALTSTWDFGDGTTEVVQGTTAITHNFETTGNFNVCVTIENEIGCTKQKCLPVNIFETAQAQFTVSDTEQCEGEVFTFTSTTTPAPISVQWDFNDDGVTDSTSPTVNYSFSDAGVYEPKLTVVYSNNCSDVEQGNVQLTVVDGIDIAFTTEDTAACSLPYVAQFTNNTTGVGTLTYEWFINDVLVGTTTDLQYTFTQFDTYDVKLVATSSAGCTAELLRENLVVVQDPEVLFENGMTVCTEQNVPIFNVTVNSVEPVEFYFWDFTGDGVVDAEGIQPNFSYSAPGIYNITLTIETVSGCVASRTSDQEINVLEEVQTNMTASTNVTCAGQEVTFCIDQQPGNTYSWNFHDNSGWVTMDLNEFCIRHDYADTGYFDLSLTVFNGACNALQTFENFIYVTPPVAMFEHSVNCTDMSLELINISILSDHVMWDFGDGTTSTEENPIHHYSQPGVYEVILTAYNDELGCPDTQGARVVIMEPNASVRLTPTSGCPPLHVGVEPSFQNRYWRIQVSNGDVIEATWSSTFERWEVSYTRNGTTTHSTSAGLDSDFFPEIIFDEQGYYDLFIETMDENGCYGSETMNQVIHVAANPNFATFTETTLDLCNNVSIQYSPNLGGLTTWQWTFSDGTTSTEENPIHQFNPPYNYSQPLSATLTATDAQGCESTVTQVLNVQLPPTPNFTAPSGTRCIGDVLSFVNTSSAPAGTTYSWNFGDGHVQSSNHSTHAYDANGNYQVCLTATSPSGCSKTKCATNTVKVLNPIASFTHSSSINNCLFGVQFNNTTSGSSSTTQWLFGDDQSGNGNIVYHTYAIGVYDVTLIVTNQHGCVDTTIVEDILNYGNQIGPFSQELEETNCAPFDVVLSAFNPSDTYFDYFWDFNDGLGDPSGSTVTAHTYQEPGTYCPSVIMTDPNGCAKLISCTTPIVVDEFTMNYTIPTEICYGDTISFTVDNGDTYLWNAEASVTVGNAPNHFYLHPQQDETFHFTGHLADCVRTDALHVKVNPLPVVSITLPAEVCHGDEAIELNMGLPQSETAYYTVNGSIATTFDPSATPQQNYVVAYHYTDSLQCSNSATQTITIHALPTITFPAFDDVCESNEVFALNQAQPAGSTYQLVDETLTHFDPARGFGEYPIVYAYTDEHGCFNEATSTLYVRSVPHIDLNFDNTCLNVPLNIENNTTLADGSTLTQSQWIFEGAGTSSLQHPQPVLFQQHGTYDFSYRAISEHGCEAMLDTSVYIYALPQLALVPHHACQYDTTAFIDISTIAEGNIISRTWQVEGQSFTTEQDTLYYAFASYDNQPVTLTATSDNGCSNTLIKQVQVRAAPVVSIAYDAGCIGVETQFEATISIPLGGVVHREWSFGDGQPNEQGLHADNLYQAEGDYTVTFTAISNLGCTTVVEEVITIHPLPDVDFALAQTQVCAGAEYSLIDLSAASDGSDMIAWSWWIDGQLVSSAQNPSLTANEAGAYNIRLSVTSDKGCTNDSTAYLSLLVRPLPEAGFMAEDEITMSHPIVNIINTSSEDVTTWRYVFGDGNYETFEDGTHTYEQWGTYPIIQYVTNTFGCKDTAVRYITVHPDVMVYIPNAFTPDGNGHNDVFLPVITGSEITLYDMQIFNRWGEMIFRSNDASIGWDGAVNGIESPDGAYTWLLEMRHIQSEDPVKKQGSVVLIR